MKDERAYGTLSDAARQIYQAHLDASTPHVFEGRAEVYCDYVALPFLLRTVSRSDVVETRKDLVDDIRMIHDWLREHNVSDYHRISRGARFVDDQTVEGFHVTYALRGALPVVEPYTSRMVLRCVDGLWKTTLADHEVAGALYPGHDARAAHGAFAKDWANAPGLATRDAKQAMSIYAAMQQRMDEANSTEDFDAWIDQYALPFQAHYDSHDTVIEQVDEARFFFDAMTKTKRAFGGDAIKRAPSYAAFLTDTQIVGYHQTTILRRGAEVAYGPIYSRMLLGLCEDGHWRCNSVTNGLKNTHHSGGGTAPTATLPTIREIKERMKN